MQKVGKMCKSRQHRSSSRTLRGQSERVHMIVACFARRSGFASGLCVPRQGTRPVVQLVKDPVQHSGSRLLRRRQRRGALGRLQGARHEPPYRKADMNALAHQQEIAGQDRVHPAVHEEDPFLEGTVRRRCQDALRIGARDRLFRDVRYKPVMCVVHTHAKKGGRDEARPCGWKTRTPNARPERGHGKRTGGGVNRRNEYSAQKRALRRRRPLSRRTFGASRR
jgi:hypothetical protein